MLSASLIGYLMGNLRYVERGMLLIGELLLIHPGIITGLIGVGILLIFILFRRVLLRKELGKEVETGCFDQQPFNIISKKEKEDLRN
jgi:UPF0716 family protein affecting phage T7 exclusion